MRPASVKSHLTFGVNSILTYSRPLLSYNMRVEFDDPDLDRLETDPDFSAGHGPDVDRGYRKAMQSVRAAPDERTLYALRGLRFEKLKGKRRQQHSMRINKQWRVIVELRGGGADRRIAIVAIEDYHA
jgi:toxin HigB-1